MPQISIGDLAQSFVMRRRNTEMKGELQKLVSELTTGRSADLGQRLSGDFKPLAAIEATLTRLKGYRTATTEGTIRADAQQAVLANIDDISIALAPGLLAAASSGSQTLIDNSGYDARQKFASVLASLNTRAGDRSLFSGMATDLPAVTDDTAILGELMQAISAETTGAGVAGVVEAWFDSPTGFLATGYLGDTQPTSAIRVAEGEEVQLDVTAADPAIRDTLKGLAMAALVEAGALPGKTGERAALLQAAGEKLLEGGTGRAYLAARVGTAQQQLHSASVRNSAEVLSLNTARAGMTSVDPYETATALEETQTQLETLYALTARISRLSLVDFLR